MLNRQHILTTELEYVPISDDVGEGLVVNLLEDSDLTSSRSSSLTCVIGRGEIPGVRETGPDNSLQSEQRTPARLCRSETFVLTESVREESICLYNLFAELTLQKYFLFFVT